ncbi:hypothetical protein [Oceanihabitans sediminis]|uniref:hypothetical protein n=1 Tax=Oceanihabitans sediminis TaxID=1812012 RepID=UPI00299E09A4|nr:hypothetical protein [Oceanihabitans sediminis]MDX1279282.1 hypothetical protein [Oceanihabitans sediminis]
MNIRLILIIAILFSSCSLKTKEVPSEILQFSEKAIEASINTEPLDAFYEKYFDQNVSEEYINSLNKNAIIWKGLEHKTELREARLTNQYGVNSEFLVKYWVTFNDGRKFSYSIKVLEKEGKLTLLRFEPLNTNIASTFYSPETNFKLPDYETNRTKIYIAYTSIFAILLILVLLAFWQRKYLLLLATPLPFIYKQGITIYNFKGIEVISPKTYFGLPHYENIDLHFSSISLTTTGAFYALTIIGLFIIFSIRRNKKMATN